MNTRRNDARRFEEAAIGGNQAHPQAPAAGVQGHVNPAGMIDGEVREALLQMEQDINTKAQDFTAQAIREVPSKENLHISTMASINSDFNWMNPHVYYGSKTNEDPHESVHEVQKILCAMGVDKEAEA